MLTKDAGVGGGVAGGISNEARRYVDDDDDVDDVDFKGGAVSGRGDCCMAKV